MFNFAYPWLFCLLPLPLVLQRLLTPAKVSATSALKVPFYNQIQSVMPQHQLRTDFVLHKHFLLWTIWVLLIMAVAGPQWYGQPIQLERSGRNILLALDISGSMQIPDMRLNNQTVPRLAIVKSAAHEFIEQRAGDRLGLILFGSNAYLQTPLTFDRNTVQYMLNDATVGLAGERTAIGDAIGIAIKRLRDVAANSRVLILLTDGANNEGVLDPLQAAQFAANENIKIYTIGIGSSQSQAVGLLSGRMMNTAADLDEETLKSIAKITDGAFFRASNGQELHQVYQQIDQLEPITDKQALFRPVTPYYYWPLSLALLLSVWLVLRRMFNIQFLTYARNSSQ